LCGIARHQITGDQCPGYPPSGPTYLTAGQPSQVRDRGDAVGGEEPRDGAVGLRDGTKGVVYRKHLHRLVDGTDWPSEPVY
jgi:hypothetical protein